MIKILVCFFIISGLLGCASSPIGPSFSDMALPKPTDERAILVFFRNYAEPTGLDGKILIDG
jgi:hypothetical protein